MTDGTWLWPVGLVHYVRDHYVRLPHEFVSHAEANEWTSPISGDSVLEGEHYNYDLAFWSDWCNSNADNWLSSLTAGTKGRNRNDEPGDEPKSRSRRF